MAIKQFITLEGAEQVVANLKKISDAGEQALAKFRESGQQFVPTDQFSNSLNQTSQALARTTSAAGEFRESLHILRPVLQEAGFAMGGIREFSIAASAGITGLAIAVGGTLLVAIQKAADSFANLQRNMQFLFGADLGSKIAANAKELATSLGGAAEDVAPALQSIQLALSRLSTFISVGAKPGEFFKGLPQDADKAKAAVDSVTRQLVVLGQTAAQAGPEADKLFATIGKIDPNTLKPVGLTLQNFITLSPLIQQALDNAFGGNLLQKLQSAKNQTIDFQTVLNKLAQADIEVKVKPIPHTFTQSVQDVKNAFVELGETLGTPGGAIDRFVENFANGLRVINALIKQLQNPPPSPTTPLFSIDEDQAQTEFDKLKTAAQAAWDGVEQIFSSGTQQLLAELQGVSWADAWSSLVTAAQTAFQQIQSAWQTLIAFINSNRPNLSIGGGSTGGGFEVPSGGAAAGGLVSGPGSGTSDSILARLSNFEYVMRAAAVKFYGVDFMHALNAMRLPKDFFRGFNLGGLVLPPFPSPPRFAQGGLAMAGQSRSLTLVLDGRSFAVAGSKSVVDDLERAADLHNLSRLGRAPGWVR